MKSVLRSVGGAACALLLAATAACGGSPSDKNGEQYINLHGSSDRAPTSTLQDWVSYADEVVVAKVTAEKEMPAIADPAGAIEGRDIYRYIRPDERVHDQDLQERQ